MLIIKKQQRVPLVSQHTSALLQWSRKIWLSFWLIRLPVLIQRIYKIICDVKPARSAEVECTFYLEREFYFKQKTATLRSFICFKEWFITCQCWISFLPMLENKRTSQRQAIFTTKVFSFFFWGFWKLDSQWPWGN